MTVLVNIITDSIITGAFQKLKVFFHIFLKKSVSIIYLRTLYVNYLSAYNVQCMYYLVLFIIFIRNGYIYL